MQSSERERLLSTLQARFEKHMSRHKDVAWSDVLARLEGNYRAMESLLEMEKTGGEPDVIEQDKQSSKYVICDCSAETPSGRRSLCYDHEALEFRKEQKPKGSAIELAASMRIEMLTEGEYMKLQGLGEFDRKTSSWIRTPAEVRKLGGALFCDRRYGKVFTYHNGAQSYYASRGFRGAIRV